MENFYYKQKKKKKSRKKWEFVSGLQLNQSSEQGIILHSSFKALHIPMFFPNMLLTRIHFPEILPAFKANIPSTLTFHYQTLLFLDKLRTFRASFDVLISFTQLYALIWTKRLFRLFAIHSLVENLLAFETEFSQALIAGDYFGLSLKDLRAGWGEAVYVALVVVLNVLVENDF